MLQVWSMVQPLYTANNATFIDNDHDNNDGIDSIDNDNNDDNNIYNDSDDNTRMQNNYIL